MALLPTHVFAYPSCGELSETKRLVNSDLLSARIPQDGLGVTGTFNNLKKTQKMFWSGRPDLNLGPPAPKASAETLSSCSRRPSGRSATEPIRRAPIYWGLSCPSLWLSPASGNFVVASAIACCEFCINFSSQFLIRLGDNITTFDSRHGVKIIGPRSRKYFDNPLGELPNPIQDRLNMRNGTRKASRSVSSWQNHIGPSSC